MTKSLLHLTPLAAIGGCEVNCLRLIKGLPGYQHRVVVFDDVGPMSSRWEQSGAEVCHLQAWRNGRAQFLESFKQWVWQQPAPHGLLCWSSSRLPDVLEALERWDSPVAVHLGNPLPKGRWLQGVRRLWEERHHIARKRTRLAACSEHVARSHRNACYFRRYPIEVIYNPVEKSLGRTRIHREFARKDRVVIGMVGRLDPIKDQVTIIRAVAALSSHWPGLMVEFAGDGALRTSLEQEALRLGVGDKVRFLGFVETPPRLAEWDVYVHSTTVAEGMGTAVAEAMIEGLPCIVSDLPVMREVCAGEAEYFPAGSAGGLAMALQAVLADQACRVRLGDAAKRRAEDLFSIEKAALAYQSLLVPLPATRKTA